MVATSSKPSSIVLATIALLGASFLVATAFSAHAETLGQQVVKPSHGISMEVGSKKVAGYYQVKDGLCDVTLMVASLPDADGRVPADISRINLPVKAGSNSRAYTSEGKGLAISCGTGAKLLSVRLLEETASAAK